jgi:PAS domain S-box-containing protein
VTHPDDLQKNLDQIALLLDGKISEFTMEKRFIRKDGRTAWGALSASALWAADEHPADFIHIAVVQDITERKRTEQALAESEKKYRQFVDTALEGIWAIDENNNTTFVNQRMADMLGYTPAEMLGQYIDVFMFAEDLPDHATAMTARKQGSAGVYERKLRRKNDSVLWCFVSGTPILDDQGRFTGSFGMFTDITERKQTEIRLAEQLTELRRWYNATLGREERILELKREVNDMLTQNGHPIRYPSALADQPKEA